MSSYFRDLRVASPARWSESVFTSVYTGPTWLAQWRPCRLLLYHSVFPSCNQQIVSQCWRDDGAMSVTFAHHSAAAGKSDLLCTEKCFHRLGFSPTGVSKWNESGFRPPLCTYRLNWARRTSWGWWDDWYDTVLQTQDSKFEPWRSEAEQ